jgi:hypothetical protein
MDPHRLGGIRAVLLDLDGVITPTAEVHEHAWAELFADFDFTPDDYLRYVDGKPRYDGVRSFLASRGVELPEGHPDDPPGDDTICAMGNRKNDTFNEIIERDGIAPYPGTMALLDLLDAPRRAVRRRVVVEERPPVLDRRRPRRPVRARGRRGHRRRENWPASRRPTCSCAAPSCSASLPTDAPWSRTPSSGWPRVSTGGFALVLGVDRGGNADGARGRRRPPRGRRPERHHR